MKTITKSKKAKSSVKKEFRRPLTPRDHKFLQAKIADPDLPDYKAAQIATGSTDMKVASMQARRMLDNVVLREELDRALVRLGFSIDAGAKALVDALQAKKTYQANAYEKNEDGTERVRTDIFESSVPDHGIRMSAARTIFQLLGDKNDGGDADGKSSITFNSFQQNNYGSPTDKR